MTLYNCDVRIKSEVIDNCNDHSFVIVGEKPMDNYDNVEHLVAFIIGDNIYNVCNSYDHGSALNCLTERYGRENATVLFLEKGKYWRVSGKIESIESLKTLREFIKSIKDNVDEHFYICVDEISSSIMPMIYKKRNLESLLNQIEYAIYKKEEELKDEYVEKIATQIQERKKRSFLESAKRFLCGK